MQRRAFPHPAQLAVRNAFSGESCPGPDPDRHRDHPHLPRRRRNPDLRRLQPHPAPGLSLALGFSPYGVPVTLTPHVRETGSEYGLTLDLHNFPQQLNVLGLRLEIWGTPVGVAHDGQRGNCLNEVEPSLLRSAKCPIWAQARPHSTQAYLTLPTSCDAPLTFNVSANSWQQPGTGRRDLLRSARSARNATNSASTRSPGPSRPTARELAERLRLHHRRGQRGAARPRWPAPPPRPKKRPDPAGGDDGQPLGRRRPRHLHARPSTRRRRSPRRRGQAAQRLQSRRADRRKPALRRPNRRLHVLRQPNEENPASAPCSPCTSSPRPPTAGSWSRSPGRVDPDPATGQLTTTFDDLPQLPYSHFNVHFREGQRSPLATPVRLRLLRHRSRHAAPGSNPDTVSTRPLPSALTSGRAAAGPARTGLAPFTPSAVAGTLNATPPPTPPSTCTSPAPTPSRRSPPTRRPCRPGCSERSPASRSARRP